MSHVEVKVLVPVVALAALGEFLGTIGTSVTDTGTSTAGNVKATPEAPAAADKPARRTRAATSAKAAEPEVKTLDYDADVKPTLVKLSSHKNGGRAKAIELVSEYGVKNAKDIPAEKLEDVLKEAKAMLEELDAATPEVTDDVSFE